MGLAGQFAHADTGGQCRNPVFEKIAGKMSVRRCGCCFPCLSNKLSQIAGVHALELAVNHGQGASLGLTISDDNLSREMDDPEWWKSQVFNLRRRLGRAGWPSRYWTVAELGETFFRPHAHYAVPGVFVGGRSLQTFDWWPFGHVHVQPYDLGTAYYMAEYMAKPEKKELRLYTGHSQKYGHAMAEMLLAGWVQSGNYPESASFEVGGKFFAMNRWFRTRCVEEGVLNSVDPSDQVADWKSGTIRGDRVLNPWETRMDNRRREEKVARRQREVSFDAQRKQNVLVNGAALKLVKGKLYE